MLFTGVFFIIMFLWRPSKHSKEYAFMQQLQTNEDDLEDAEDEFVQGPDTIDDNDTAIN